MFCTIFYVSPFFQKMYFYFSLMESNIYIAPLKSTSLGDEITMQTSPLHDVFTVFKE
jgi:hypothetical protein